MIKTFRHKGLKRLYEQDDARGIRTDLAPRVRVILNQLDQAQTIDDMSMISFRLHPLKGDLKGFWSVTVRANWRIIFRLENGDASDVGLIDYH